MVHRHDRGRHVAAMRIGLLTQWFEPEPGPAALPGMLARALAGRGHEVRVLTGFPNYPTGRIVDGYRQRRRLDEISQGVHVRRVALFPSHDSSPVRRFANYGSFATSALLSGMDVLGDVDVLWVNYSPVTIGLPMFVQAWRHRTPTVVHVLDLWPDTLFASHFAARGVLGRAAETALTTWCGSMYSRASLVGYISPGVGPVLEQRGVPARKLRYAPMWADESVFRPLPLADERRWGLGAGTVALGYAGTLGGAQDLTTLIRACARVQDLDLRCLVAGSGVQEESLRRLAEEVGATNVRFLGRLDKAQVMELMAASDLQYVGLNGDPLSRVTLPSKVQSILACGRPIVGSVVGDAAGVVARAGGWPVPPGDVDGLSAALRTAVRIGRRGLWFLGGTGREVYDEEFAMDVAIGRVEQMLEEAAHLR